MAYGDSYRDSEDARRFRNRSILLFIILATLPCYIVGGILLGVAPNNNDVVTTERTLPPALQSTSSINPGGQSSQTMTVTVTQTLTSTPNVTATASQTLRATPRQQSFPTNTPFPSQVLPSSTATPTHTVTASATLTQTATHTLTATVEANSPPTFDTPQGELPLALGATQTILASDPDGDTLSVVASSTDNAIASITFVQDGFTITANAIGTATITTIATDSQEQSTQFVYTVVVTSPNRAPVFVQEPANVTVEVGQSQAVTLSLNDPDGDVVIYDLSPSNPSLITLSGVNDADYQFTITGVAEGVLSMVITISDGRGGTDSRTVTVTVNAAVAQNNAPTIDNIAANPLVLTNGDSDLVTVQSSDVDGDPLTLTPVNNNPELFTVTPLDNVSFTVMGTAAGTGTITVTVDDGTETVSQTLNVTIEAANQAPQLSQPIIETLTLAAAEVEPVQLFYADPDGDFVTLTVTTFDPNIATVIKIDEFNFNITAVAAGTTPIFIQLSDGRGGIVEDSISVTVSP